MPELPQRGDRRILAVLRSRQRRSAIRVSTPVVRGGRRKTKTDAHGGTSMSFYRGMTCENVTLKGDKGTPITAYVAKPAGSGECAGGVLIPRLPGWSGFYIESTRRFAHHGCRAICANLYERGGGGSDGNPD